MTQPSDNPAPPPSSPATPKPSETQPKESTTQASSSNKRYKVYTPWHCDELHGGDSFPTVTPHGTEMSEAEADAAVVAGNSLLLRLTVEEV